MIAGFLIFLDRFSLIFIALAACLDIFGQSISEDRLKKKLFESYYPLLLCALLDCVAYIFFPDKLLLALSARLLIMIWFFALNWHRAGLNLLIAGTAMNLLVRVGNAGKMPIVIWAVEDSSHAYISEYSRLLFLTDWIKVNEYWMSVGDICILVGVFLFALCQVYLFISPKSV